MTKAGAFVVVGGLAPDNSRLGDVWVLEEEGKEGGEGGALGEGGREGEGKEG